MTNHMKEVANILGVEIGERFSINDTEPIYYFSEDGLHSEELGDWLCGFYINHLLSGEYTIKRKSWKPAYHERYYSVGLGGALEPGDWMGDFIDCALYKLGNCYRTAEEAQANREKWVAFYNSDKTLEV